MNERLLDWLACPRCGAVLALVSAIGRSDDVEAGTLACRDCQRTYPIVRRIPRLIPDAPVGEAAATADRFGYEWRRFAEIRPQYDAQFRGWIAPLGPDAFAGRRVLDAGCGKGRHLRLAAAYGATEVVGVELGSAVDVAAHNTRDLPNVHVIQADLTRPPIRRGSVDLIYSIGVLHHLPEPLAGFRALVPLLVPNGRLIAWVYAREGNGWVLALVDPVRRATRRLPLPLVNGLAWLLALPVWLAVQLLYTPARNRDWLRHILPYQSYLTDLASFPFREVHSIAFDQLLAPVAHYMPRTDIERCFRDAQLDLRSLRWHHANSWAAWGAREPGTEGIA